MDTLLLHATFYFMGSIIFLFGSVVYLFPKWSAYGTILFIIGCVFFSIDAILYLIEYAQS